MTVPRTFFYVAPHSTDVRPGKYFESTMIEGFTPISRLHCELHRLVSADVPFFVYPSLPPAFIVTTKLRDAFVTAGMTGMVWDTAEITIIPYADRDDDRDAPYTESAYQIETFAWLKPVGKIGHDDFAPHPDPFANTMLCMSDRALAIARQHGLHEYECSMIITDELLVALRQPQADEDTPACIESEKHEDYTVEMVSFPDEPLAEPFGEGFSKFIADRRGDHRDRQPVSFAQMTWSGRELAKRVLLLEVRYDYRACEDLARLATPASVAALRRLVAEYPAPSLHNLHAHVALWRITRDYRHQDGIIENLAPNQFVLTRQALNSLKQTPPSEQMGIAAKRFLGQLTAPFVWQHQADAMQILLYAEGIIGHPEEKIEKDLSLQTALLGDDSAEHRKMLAKAREKYRQKRAKQITEHTPVISDAESSDDPVSLHDHRLLRDWAPQLAEKLERSQKEIIASGLGCCDFGSGGTLRIKLDDGGRCDFQYAFHLVNETRGIIGVFTEHCGYHQFPLAFTTIDILPTDWRGCDEPIIMKHRDIITREPEKMGGSPCIRGMRITVSDVIIWIGQGMTRAEIAECWPQITDTDIAAAFEYAYWRCKDKEMIM